MEKRDVLLLEIAYFMNSFKDNNLQSLSDFIDKVTKFAIFDLNIKNNVPEIFPYNIDEISHYYESYKQEYDKLILLKGTSKFTDEIKQRAEDFKDLIDIYESNNNMLAMYNTENNKIYLNLELIRLDFKVKNYASIVFAFMHEFRHVYQKENNIEYKSTRYMDYNGLMMYIRWHAAEDEEDADLYALSVIKDIKRTAKENMEKSEYRKFIRTNAGGIMDLSQVRVLHVLARPFRKSFESNTNNEK